MKVPGESARCDVHGRQAETQVNRLDHQLSDVPGQAAEIRREYSARCFCRRRSHRSERAPHRDVVEGSRRRARSWDRIAWQHQIGREQTLSFSTAKRLLPKAQGCRGAATRGKLFDSSFNPEGVEDSATL